jgi:hypothetical protein
MVFDSRRAELLLAVSPGHCIKRCRAPYMPQVSEMSPTEILAGILAARRCMSFPASVLQAEMHVDLFSSRVLQRTCTLAQAAGRYSTAMDMVKGGCQFCPADSFHG